MKYILVAVYDTAVGAFQPINCVRAPGEAVRSFQNAINDVNTGHLHRSPEHFDLFQVGAFDDETGQLEQLEKPKLLAKGDQLTLKTGGITITQR